MMSRAVIPAMIAPQNRQDRQHVLDRQERWLTRCRSPYASSKWGLVGFTLTLAQELGPLQHSSERNLPGPHTDGIDRIGYSGARDRNGRHLRSHVAGIRPRHGTQENGPSRRSRRPRSVPVFFTVRRDYGRGYRHQRGFQIGFEVLPRARSIRIRSAMALQTREDLNFNRIVSNQFDRAAKYLQDRRSLCSIQIKACNNVYYFQFPVRFGDNHYEIFEGWRGRAQPAQESLSRAEPDSANW